MLFNGMDGIEAHKVEGLMWMTMARNRLKGTPDEKLVAEKLDKALAISSPEQQAEATELDAIIGKQFSGL